MNTLTLLSGQWMPSRLRYPLLFLLPLLWFGTALLPGARFLPILPVSQAPLASESPELAREAARGANLVATDRLFPQLSDELEIRDQLLEGVLPTWNPKAGLGSPLAASSLNAPWNPLRWPWLLFDPALASGWHALISLVLAGLGMMMFLEGRGLKFTAAMFGAFAYQSCGFFVANLHYVMKVDAAIWAPWCLWGVDLVYRGRKNAGLIVFFGVAMSALAGFPQVFLFVAALTLAWILKRALEAIRENHEHREWKQSLGACLLFAGLGVLGGSVHLYPMWEASSESSRQLQEPSAIHAQSLPLAASLTMVMPAVFGAPTDPWPASKDPAVWWLLGKGDLERGLNANRLEWHLYLGVTVLALVLAGLLSRFRAALFPALIALGTCGFLFAWPLFEYLYGLPGANLGAPARAAPIAALGLAWVAALGFDSLLDGNSRARLGSILVGLLLGTFALVLWLGIDPQRWAVALEESLVERYSVDLETVRAFFSREDAVLAGQRLVQGAKSLMMFAVLVCVLAIYAGRLTVRGSGVAGCALLVFEATLAGIPQASVPPPASGPLFPPSETLEAIARTAQGGRVLRIDRSESGIGDVLELARPNLLQVYGIKDLSPYTAFPSRRLFELWSALDSRGTYRGGLASLTDASLLDRPLLDALRVTCVLSREAIDHPRLELHHRREDFHVYSRSGALEEARVVPELRAAGDDALAQLTSVDHDFAGVAIHGDLTTVAPSSASFNPGELRIVRPQPGRVDISLNNSDGGYLVIHEAWAPDWKATINGRDAEVLRMDHVFLGLEVPQGSTVIRMKYEPWSLRIGACLSILALLLTLWITRRRHKARNRDRLSRALLPHAYSESR